MTTAKINRAIRHLGLEIIHARGSGYSYFLALDTGDQAGESVPVCYLHSLTLDRWVEEAETAAAALKAHREEMAELEAERVAYAAKRAAGG